MKPKHWTLNPLVNALLALSWGCISLALITIPERHPWLPAIVGGLFGVFIGRLQRRSFAEAPAAFLAADSARAVRAAVTSTASGKRALLIQWASLVAIVAAALVQPADLIAGWFSGYSALMCLRDFVALPGTRQLASDANAPAPPNPALQRTVTPGAEALQRCCRLGNAC